MLGYISERLVSTLIVLFGVSVLSFLILQLVPGDPVQIMLGQTGASAAQMATLRHELGLDQPVWMQYWRFLTNALHGNLGMSIVQRQPVGSLILEQLPYTIQLTVAGMVVAVVVGMGAGVVAAIRPNSWVDGIVMVAATVGVAIPGFWLALLLIYAFAVYFQLLPATGGIGWKPLIMPAITLGLGGAAVIARLTRASMLEVLRQEYIVTARAKGVTGRAVLLHHALKNALIPVITVVGLQFGSLLSGAVIIETVFARPGIGRLAVDAILNKDYPLVQGTILVAAVAYVLTNLAVDLVYMFVDPRIRYD
jgi:peptide/nickel transport system permease protein